MMYEVRMTAPQGTRVDQFHGSYAVVSRHRVLRRAVNAARITRKANVDRHAVYVVTPRGELLLDYAG